MPLISMFFGIIVSLCFQDTRRHHRPHIHVKGQENEAVLALPEGELPEGGLPAARMKLVLAWMEIHRDGLLADWVLAAEGQQAFRIEPWR